MNEEGRNLEEINKKKILNFGNLCENQKSRGISVSWTEALIKCERCNNENSQKKATWKDSEWSLPDGWKVYLRKAQVKKHDIGYYIVGGIQLYCPGCDRKYNKGGQ